MSGAPQAVLLETDDESPVGNVLERPPASRRMLDRVTWVLPVVALVIAWTSVRNLDVSGITDLGLASVLPAGYYAALGVLTAGFVLALRGQRERVLLVVAHVAAAVVLLYGVTLPIEEVPSFNVVYRHAGIIDHLSRGEPIDAGIDAYFNWPGFFILAEFLADLAGLDSVLPIASFAPIVFNLLALPALVAIAKAATRDWRTGWVGIWIYYLANWVGQDYLAPQAFAFVLYLTLAVALLTALSGPVDGPPAWWRRRLTAMVRRLARRRSDAAPTGAVPLSDVPRLERGGTVLVCTLLFAALVASHQLTPFAALLLVVTLVAAGLSTARLLPLVGSLLLGAWLSFMAVDYLAGEGQDLLTQALDVGSSVSANVGERVNGSDEHLVIIAVRLAVSGALWAVAAVGVARMRRRGRSAPGHALLAFVPLVLVLVQPYGGEVLLRAYLFALPFVAVLVACALFPPGAGAWSRRRSGGLLLVSLVLLTAFVFTRYGNQRAFLYTPDERAAVTYLYENAAPGDVLAAASPNVPWQDRGYAEYDYQVVPRLIEPPAGEESPVELADRVADALHSASRGADAYLLITRSQLTYEEMLGSLPWASVRAIRDGALRSEQFRLVHDNPDALVFVVEETP